MHHDELLAQAKHLSALPNATQADLRRAVSSAYYALFHFFVHETVEHLLGGRPVTAETRQTFARAFSHTSMREACSSFAGRQKKPTPPPPPGSPPRPDRVVELPRVGSVTIPGGLQAIAGSFVTLIEARHTADYDLSTPTAKSEADALILEAEHAMQAWAAFRQQPIGYQFLSGLLLYKTLQSAR